jgi:hypothetical protein
MATSPIHRIGLVTGVAALVVAGIVGCRLAGKIHWNRAGQAGMSQTLRSNKATQLTTAVDGDAAQNNRFVVGEEGSETPFLRDLLAWLKAIEGEADPFEREQKLTQLVEGMDIAEVPGAIRLLDARSSWRFGFEFELRLVRRWVAEDPEQASAWAEGIGGGEERRQILDTVAIAWANQDMDADAQWARQLPTEEERWSALSLVANEVARREPAVALSLALELSASQGRDDLITHALSEWAAHDGPSAASWAARNLESGLRERAFSEIAAAWSDSDPMAAATFTLQALPPGKPLDDSVVGIVQRWVQKEPPLVAGWVEHFPEGVLRNTALEVVAKLWADADVEQSASWLTDLPPGLGRDVAVGAYALQIAPRFPDQAADWALSIDEDSLRRRHVEAVGQTWSALDADAATAWLNTPAARANWSAPGSP